MVMRISCVILLENLKTLTVLCYPLPGIAGRFITLEIGNKFTDSRRSVDWRDDSDTKKGDVLRLLAYRGVEVQEGTDGQFSYSGALVFQDTTAPAAFEDSNVGDIIQVYEDPTPPATHVGYYIIKSILTPTQVVIEQAYGTPLVSSTANLSWKHYKGLYFESFVEDHEIDYIDGVNLVGNYEDVFPLTYANPLIYAIVRDVADPTIVGQDINNPVTMSNPGFTDLGHKHLIPDTVDVNAWRVDGLAVREGYDFTVDYLRGIINPIAYSYPPLYVPTKDEPYWDPASPIHKCNYEWRREVLLGAEDTQLKRTKV